RGRAEGPGAVLAGEGLSPCRAPGPRREAFRAPLAGLALPGRGAGAPVPHLRAGAGMAAGDRGQPGTREAERPLAGVAGRPLLLRAGRAGGVTEELRRGARVP